jgi:hypothetical protein
MEVVRSKRARILSRFAVIFGAILAFVPICAVRLFLYLRPDYELTDHLSYPRSRATRVTGTPGRQSDSTNGALRTPMP